MNLSHPIVAVFNRYKLSIRSLSYMLFLLFSVSAFSQSVSEIQLRRDLSAAATDSAKARISGQLAWDLKFIHNEEALKLVEDEIRLSHGDPLRLADANRTKGLILVTQNKPQEGLECYKLSMENARKAKDYYYEASCYSLTAGMYQDLGDYDRSLQYYLDGLKVAESGKNKKMIATILNNIATIYDASGRENAKALSYFSRALKQAKEMGEFAFAGMICSNMANEYVILKHKDSAEIMMKAAIDFSNRSGKRGYEYASSLRGVGEIYSILDRPKEAEACLKEAMVLMDSLKRPLNVLDPITGLAQLYLKKGRISDAQVMGDRLLKDATHYGAKLFIREAYKVLSDVAHRKGQDALALEYLKQYNVWNDSIFNDTKEKSIASIQSRANLARKNWRYSMRQRKKRRRTVF
jgi:tetratricopeptide (TPR) repeat protein